MRDATPPSQNYLDLTAFTAPDATAPTGTLGVSGSAAFEALSASQNRAAQPYAAAFAKAFDFNLHAQGGGGKMTPPDIPASATPTNVPPISKGSALPFPNVINHVAASFTRLSVENITVTAQRPGGGPMQRPLIPPSIPSDHGVSTSALIGQSFAYMTVSIVTNEGNQFANEFFDRDLTREEHRAYLEVVINVLAQSANTDEAFDALRVAIAHSNPSTMALDSAINNIQGRLATPRDEFWVTVQQDSEGNGNNTLNSIYHDLSVWTG